MWKVRNRFAVCPVGKYGDGCAQECGRCIHGDCDPVSGSCVCHSGWEGATCEQGIIYHSRIFIKLEPMAHFTLTEINSVTDSDSDSKPNGYIVLCKMCSHCTDLDSDPYSLFLFRTGIRVWVRTRVRFGNVNEPLDLQARVIQLFQSVIIITKLQITWIIITLFSTDIPGCDNNSCHAGVSCTDVSAPGTGFQCGGLSTQYDRKWHLLCTNTTAKLITKENLCGV